MLDQPALEAKIGRDLGRTDGLGRTQRSGPRLDRRGRVRIGDGLAEFEPFESESIRAAARGPRTRTTQAARATPSFWVASRVSVLDSRDQGTRRTSMAVQRSITTARPASAAIRALSQLTTPSWSHSARAPIETASRAISGVSSGRRKTSTMSILSLIHI